MDRIDDTTVFESRRSFLLGLAYRLLGSRAEAEDVVQDLFIKWLEADKASIATPAAWLTTACTRHCIDLLRSAQRSRLQYVGTWLPEPIHTLHHHSPEQSHELASSLSTAFLLLLERLTPKERAAYLLYDIFDLDYPQVAQTLGVQEATCRKLVSRAKASLGNTQARYQPDPSRQEQLLNAFHSAITSGSTQGLAAMLSEDVELCADGGGKASAIRETLYGLEAVLAFVGESLSRYWRDYQWQEVEINGGRGVVLRGGEEVVAALSFGYDVEGRVNRVFIMRNPDKLVGLGSGGLV
ncbi:RNA polymerase sigma-70 factor, ECF subfamily [Pseudomonas chlororaphis]|uniref:RNA polymerase sigma factor SigJ n=1 Tax=Pseudomonas chlororaphis TaxID=587753 RepID=UPI00087CCFB5|nr:RNA polymerase sigma factor SigJ [Pseudomonas chlororaphis]AZD66316.1 Putative RNA polymerase sigma factor [Pseudomonas chlororaphis subsp. aurantiaca]QIT22396.1 RNA polymerase sigma factor SigJ [Pseudomonas chlororaphis subsp. aurantiaca]WDH06557.1 RNA polymerase sigma factor SigJ [Pseudomonas chlororaphis]WDH10689.1 RNA polymerase sigma factor SigJ [Pseudomonas chlororaphis]SDT34928.1 RNA polymerase sigma-70 factor, ECF subfamily [Pseudomonas chlororaphis]